MQYQYHTCNDNNNRIVVLWANTPQVHSLGLINTHYHNNTMTRTFTNHTSIVLQSKSSTDGSVVSLNESNGSVA